MKQEYEYDIQVFELKDSNADLIKNVLNKKGRQGYSIVSVNEFGGYQSPKKIMYTLTREKTEYNPFEEPEFYKLQQSLTTPLGDGIRFASKANNLPLPESDGTEPAF